MSDVSDCINNPVLWVEPRASGMLGKNLTYGATFPAPDSSFYSHRF